MKHTPEQVRDISEKVYRIELAAAAGGNDAEWKAKEADRMIEKVGQDKFSRFAGSAYDRLTRVYLDVLGIEPK